MGPKTIRTSIKDHRIIFLFVALLCFIEFTSCNVKNLKRNDKRELFLLSSFCRKHILAPPCRGIQKRDIVSRLNDDYKSSLQSDLTRPDRSNSNEQMLGELLQKAMDAPSDYDHENY